MEQPVTHPLPHWNFDNVYPALDSEAFQADFAGMIEMIAELEAVFNTLDQQAGTQPQIDALARSAGDLVERLNALQIRASTLRAFLTGFTAVDSFHTEARRLESQFQLQGARMENLHTRFRSWVGSVADHLPQMADRNPVVQAHLFALQEAAERSRYQMSAAEESLAAQLSLSGSRAWGKLQGTVTSQMTVDFDLDGETQKLSMPALINLRSHPDEDVRRRAYEAESAAWVTVREPLAAALNGIKGETITLAARRGYADPLQIALDMARIDRATLDAMLGAMVDSLPVFRRYYAAKARLIGKDKLAWWDLFAPAGKSERQYNWPETREFLLQNFDRFSPDLAALAQRAFDQQWIDAESRRGKRGGAFCMGVPGVKESRILTNFDGSLDQVSTVAHELGHAYHNHCIYNAGKTILQSRTPMTLAETASIMNETIVQQAILERAASAQEALAVLETSLIGDSQVIVDIYSRFLFESEVFRRRANAELSADEFCEVMEWAQKQAYGDGLDERFLQPYMWTWKPHYYSADLPFYNFPYAFGLLFGTGLYAIYQQRGAAFVPDYQALLASTGEDNAANLAARFAIDIRQKDFWAGSLRVIEERVEQYANLID